MSQQHHTATDVDTAASTVAAAHSLINFQFISFSTCHSLGCSGNNCCQLCTHPSNAQQRLSQLQNAAGVAALLLLMVLPLLLLPLPLLNKLFSLATLERLLKRVLAASAFPCKHF